MALPQTDQWKIIESPENLPSRYGKLMSDQNGILIEKKLFSILLYSMHAIPTTFIGHKYKSQS